MLEEIFVDIPQYEGLYQISNYGRVKSLERDTYMPNGIRNGHINEHFLAQSVKDNQYLQVTLYKNNKARREYVHRLVGLAFIPNPDKKPQIDHIDTDRQNNYVENLRWVTQSENNLNLLTREKKIGKVINGTAIMKCDLEGNELAQYESMRQAERENHLGNGTISRYFQKGYGQCGGFTWKIID